MTAKLALPITPGHPTTNPLEGMDFAVAYAKLEPKFIQIEKEYLSRRKDKISEVEQKFADNNLPSRLTAEVTSFQISDPRGLAMASARGLCLSPDTEQKKAIEKHILEFIETGLFKGENRGYKVNHISLPQDQGLAIPAIEITKTEAEPWEVHERLQRNEVVFEDIGKFLLYFKDGRLQFSFDYETAKPQDMESRMKAGLGYLNTIANHVYQYFQLESRTVILPLDKFRERTLVDFERWDYKTIEERVEHLGGYNEDTLSRIEKFRDNVISHFQTPEKGKPPNLFLTGPTGAGKTTVARALARAFGERGIQVFKLSDREPINTDTLTRSIKAFIRNKTGGVLIIEDLVDYLKEATPEQFKEAQASLIQTLKKLADMPNHVVIYNSERLDKITQDRVALLQSHRTDMMFLEPDTTASGIESLLRATMARSLSTDSQLVTKDSTITTEHLDRISGNNLANFILQIQQIDQDFPGVGLTPNMIGTTSRTEKQAGKLDWKTARIEEVLSEIRHNLDSKSRLNPESPFEKARLAVEEYEMLLRLLQEIQKRGGIEGWEQSIVGALMNRIQALEKRVVDLETPQSSSATN